MPHALVAAALEHVAKAIEVALDVGRGVLNRVTPARLGGQVHHRLGFAVREQRGDPGSILQIALHELPLPTRCLDPG